MTRSSAAPGLKLPKYSLHRQSQPYHSTDLLHQQSSESTAIQAKRARPEHNVFERRQSPAYACAHDVPAPAPRFRRPPFFLPPPTPASVLLAAILLSAAIMIGSHRTRSSLAALLMCLKRSGPRCIPPNLGGTYGIVDASAREPFDPFFCADIPSILLYEFRDIHVGLQR